MPNFCKNESECCMKCQYLSSGERLAASEHFLPDGLGRVDRPYGGCRHYCGRFEADADCIACRSRVLIAARAKEIQQAVQLELPYEAKGWVCYGL